jgi:hypothetical protein
MVRGYSTVTFAVTVEWMAGRVALQETVDNFVSGLFLIQGLFRLQHFLINFARIVDIELPTVNCQLT